MLPEPTQPQSRDLEFVVVPPDKPSRQRGHPRRLTLKRFVAIIRNIESGASVTTACEAQAVTYQIFRLRCSRSERLEERYQKALRTRDQVRAERALESILQWGAKSWMAHAWYLERSAPDRWSLRPNLTRFDPEAEQSEPELPAEILAHHRRLMLAMLAEGEPKQALGNS
jgi:hypothetical protein